MKKCFVIFTLILLTGCQLPKSSEPLEEPNYGRKIKPQVAWPKKEPSQTSPTAPKMQTNKKSRRVVFSPPQEDLIKPAPPKELSSAKPQQTLRILAWGGNTAGQLGNGLRSFKTLTSTWAYQVEQILKPSYTVKQIDAGYDDACLIRSDDTVWCWGGKRYSRLNEPVNPVSMVQNLPRVKKLKIGGARSACAQDFNNQIWCWSSHDEVKTARQRNFIIAEKNSNKDFHEKILSAVDEVYLGEANRSLNEICVKTLDGKLACSQYRHFDYNFMFGQKDKYELKEIPVPGSVRLVSMSAAQSCAILEDKSAWCWENRLNKIKPIKVFSNNQKALQVLSDTAIGCALLDDGSVWCWPSLGSRASNRHPYETVKNITPYKKLDGVKKLDNDKGSFFCALKEDGSVWCWGGNSTNPEESDTKELTQIRAPDGITNIENVIDIAVGKSSGYALTSSNKQYFDAFNQPDPSILIPSLVVAGDFDTAKQVLKLNPKFDTSSQNADEAFIAALDRGEPEIVKAFVDNGIDIELPRYKQTTALLLAANPSQSKSNPEIMRVLVEAGANLEARHIGNGKTALDLLNSESASNNEAIEIITEKLDDKIAPEIKR